MKTSTLYDAAIALFWLLIGNNIAQGISAGTLTAICFDAAVLVFAYSYRNALRSFGE